MRDDDGNHGGSVVALVVLVLIFIVVFELLGSATNWIDANTELKKQTIEGLKLKNELLKLKTIEFKTKGE